MADTAQATAEATAEVSEQQNAPAEGEQKTEVQSAEFPEAAEPADAAASGSIDILLDMSIPVTVTIGKTQMPIRSLLRLGPGSVVRLDKAIDEPAELYLKDSKFATGTIVVVDGTFAVRIEQILGSAEPKAEQNQN